MSELGYLCETPEMASCCAFADIFTVLVC